ncbi:MAG: translocation/assembly module TamB domain-containing protein [Rhodospirillales bacterium]
MLLILLPPLLVLLALETGPGQRFAAEQLTELLSTPDSGIEIADLGGSLWDRLTVGRVVLSDAEGPWLTVTGVSLDWSPFALLSSEASIRLLEVETVDMPRPPLPGDQPSQDEGDDSVIPQLPELPVAIDLERLRVGAVILGQPLVGVPANFTVTGQATWPQSGKTSLALNIDGQGDTELSVSADLGWTPEDDVLAIDLSVEEPKGGLVSSLAGLPTLPALDVSLDGEGPLSNWQGSLRVALDGVEAVKGDLTLAGTPERRLALIGRVDPSGTLPPELLPEEARPWLAGGAALDVAAVLGDEVVTLERLTLQATTLALSASGTLEPESEQVDAQLAVNLADQSPLRELVPEVALGALSLQASVQGDLALPQARLSAKVDGVTTAEAEVGTVALEVEALPQDGKIDTKVDLRLTDPKVLVADVPPLPYGNLHLNLQALVSPEEGSALLQRLKLRGDDLNLSLEGDLALPDLVGKPQLHLDALLPELGGVEPLLADLPLSVTLDSALALNGLDQPIAANLDATLVGTAGLPDGIGTLLGDGLNLFGGVTYAPDGSLTLSDVSLLGPHLSVEVDGDVGEEELALTWQVALDDLAAAQDLAGSPAGGSFDAKGRFSQSAEGRLEIEADLEGQGLSFGGETLGDLEGRISVAGTLPALSGDIDLSLPNSGYGPLSLSAKIAPGENETFRVAPLTLALGREVQIAGDLTVPAAGLPISGRLRGSLAGGRLLANLGVPLAGRGNLEVALSGRGEQQDAAVTLRLEPGSLADIPHGGIALEAKVRDATGALRLDGSLSASDLKVEPASLESLAVTFEGTPENLAFTVKTEGDVEGPTELTVAGKVAQRGARILVTLTSLDGQVAGFPLTQTQQTEVALGPAGPERASTGLRLAGADLTLEAVLAGRERRVDLALQGLNLKQFERFMDGDQITGTVAANLSLRGNRRAQGQLSVTLSQLSVQEEGLPLNPPLDAKLDGQFGAESLALTGSVEGNFGNPLRLSANMPLTVSLAEPGVDLDQNAPLSGQITWQGDMGPLVDLMPIGEQRLTGQGKIDLAVAGTLDVPQASGTVEITNGRYENLLTATIVRDLNLRLRGSQQRLVVEEASGNDGQNGTLSLTGAVDLANDPAPAVQLALKINDFALARRDDLYARMDVDMTVEGDLSNGLKVAGTITNEEIRANVISDLPRGVADLPVELVRDGKVISGGETEKEEEAGAAPPLPVVLDITVNMPRRVFVAGAGLESEWGGTLVITGTADQPFITGSLGPLRGYFALFGKQFDLKEGSTVAFDGSADIDPTLDLAAVYDTDDIVATISITGSAQAPKITLSSDPELPNDEILSQVLFGRGTGQISPVEAFQLAEAAAILSGASGSGVTVVDRIRQTIGVDVLRVESGDEDDEVVATVGEYVSEDVFVGVRQGTDPGSTQATVEVELLPGLKFEGRAGADSEADNGAMLRWEWNY